ncbi:hypothetical protein AX16_009896 [Volvariella volvacea WC 439]|nr:hypothetical protein AX16_009896 [Volvariella volvacea WC 439]
MPSKKPRPPKVRACAKVCGPLGGRNIPASTYYNHQVEGKKGLGLVGPVQRTRKRKRTNAPEIMQNSPGPSGAQGNHNAVVDSEDVGPRDDPGSGDDPIHNNLGQAHPPPSSSPSPAPDPSDQDPLDTLPPPGYDEEDQDPDGPADDEPPQSPDIDSLPEATLAELKCAQEVVQAIRNAQLRDDITDEEMLKSIQNPSKDLPELDADGDASFRLYNAMSDCSEKAYERVRCVWNVALYPCQHLGKAGLKVIKVGSMFVVVGMPPLPLRAGEDEYKGYVYVAEKPFLEIAQFTEDENN